MAEAGRGNADIGCCISLSGNGLCRLTWDGDFPTVVVMCSSKRLQPDPCPCPKYEAQTLKIKTKSAGWLKRARRRPLRYRPLEEYLAERKRG